MRLYEIIDAIVKTLDLTAESDHFLVRYRRRDPLEGRGAGARGVQDAALIGTYVEALERGYDAMRGRFGCPPPRTDETHKTFAYVFDIRQAFPNDSMPFTWSDQDGVPFICLPCRSPELTPESASLRAAAEAVHETAHVFLNSARDPSSKDAERWRWFDEAVAAHVEGLVLPNNPYWLGRCYDWCDEPNGPLDDGGTEDAGLFVGYLRRRLDEPVLRQLWDIAQPGETPLAALNRLLDATRSDFRSTDADVCELFADYALESYFLWDEQSPAYAPEVYRRFGPRAPADSLRLGAGQRRELADRRLNHLSCEYVAIRFESHVSHLRIAVTTDVAGVGRLRAQAVVIAGNRRRGQTMRLEHQPTDPRPVSRLNAELSLADTDPIDHVVLVISNCGIGIRNDNRSYSVEIKTF